MHRYEWRRRIEQLDPVTDYHEIYRIMVAHEFPWDMNQALSFALFRTYAVPSIGGLLARTGEFLEHTQQRYDDTTLILDAVVEHGSERSCPGCVPPDKPDARAYRISNDDLRYVLSTFVVVPMRWMNSYGWRPFTEPEKVASANYYRGLGAHMNIKSIPATYRDFIALADAYEREHFGFDEGGRAVAESTLKLLATFPPSDRLPSSLGRRASYALMDDPLLARSGSHARTRLVRALVRVGLTARGRVVRFLPPRTEPRYARQSRTCAAIPTATTSPSSGRFPPAGTPTDPGPTPPRRPRPGIAPAPRERGEGDLGRGVDASTTPPIEPTPPTRRVRDRRRSRNLIARHEPFVKERGWSSPLLLLDLLSAGLDPARGAR